MTTIGFGGFGAAPAAPGAAKSSSCWWIRCSHSSGTCGRRAAAAATPAAGFGAAAPAPTAGGFGATTPAPAAFGAPSSLLGAPTTAAAAAPDPSVAALAASRARLQALGLVTDAIRTSASLGSPLPDSTITKATAILKDPFNGLTLDIATVAAQRAASANNSTMGSVAADSSAVSPLTFQPFTEASQTGIALLSILMSSTQQQRQTSSSSYSDDVGALLGSVAPSLVSSLIRFLMKAPSQLVAPVTVSSTSNGSNNNNNNLSAAMQSQFLSPTAGGSTDYQNAMLAFKSSGSSNPLLLAAEALFLLTR
ncbi:GPI-anchored surface protein, putative, partial [Bodo saltans]